MDYECFKIVGVRSSQQLAGIIGYMGERKGEQMDYRQMTDEEIISCIQKQDASAMDFLLEKYKGLVRQKAKTLYLIGGDRDDLIQEGMIGLYKAVRDYDPGKEASFFPFAELCITRQMYSAIRASNRMKNQPLNNYISFNAPIKEGSDEMEEGGVTFGDSMPASKKANPEELLIDKENLTVLEYELGKRLSDMEQKVMGLYREGVSYTDIAQQLHKTPKSIDNTLQRIRRKLSGLLGEMER